MHLTTKGRYAVMAMVDVAFHAKEQNPLSLAEIAHRQSISHYYLEQIFLKLRKSNLVSSVRGPGGGYVLQKTSEEITIADIINAVEEPLHFTRCHFLEKDQGCQKDSTQCMTHDLWKNLEVNVYNYLSSVSLMDICKTHHEKTTNASSAREALC